MLQAMRVYSRSVVAVLMFLILIITFGVWGVGDIFRNRVPDPIAADVAGTEIHARELRSRFNQELERLQATTGQSIPADQAIKLGLPMRVLQNMIQEALNQHLVKDYGLAVSDDYVREVIAQEPAFRNQQGSFDRNIYERLLQRMGMTEAGYVASLKRDVATDQLFGTMVEGVIVTPEYSDLLYRFRNEKRVAETILIPYSGIKDVPAPSDSDLAAYYEANKAAFAQPEYRKVKYIYVKASDIVSDIKIPENKVREEYDIRRKEFTQPETREVDQVLLPSEDKAKAVADLLQKGKTLEDAAKEVLGRDNGVIKLGAVKKADLPAGLADAAFSLKAGGTSQPIRSALGWHVLRVDKITPESIKPFEAVHDQLVAGLKKDEAPDKLMNMANDLEKQLDHGASYADAAARLGVKVRTADAIDIRGNTPAGTPAADLPANKDFLRIAFSLAKGDDSTLTENNDGDFFVLRVEDITPARIPELSEIKPKVAAAWRETEIRKVAEKQVGATVDRLNAGGELAAVAKAENAEVKTTKAVTRSQDDAADNLPATLVVKLFALQPGHSAYALTDKGVAIARLKEIDPVDPTKDAAGVEAISAQARQVLQSDLLYEFDQIVRKRYPVTIHNDVMAQTFPAE